MSMHEKAARVPRFFTGAALGAGSTTQLPEEAAHHAVHVLRLRAGDALTLFDGRGGEYGARIAAMERLRVSVDVLAHRALERESPLAVTLVRAYPPAGMDSTVRRPPAGVAALQPVLAARSTGRITGERAAQKRAHWQRVAIAACEQCGRNRVPEVLAPVALAEYCRGAAPAGALLLSPEARLALREAVAGLQGAATLAAGPEAGFTAQEEALLAQAGFVPVRLGPRVLRTETAALAALAALNALAGDF
jgi:16S rRNA (uracil1498-N3)-methyltransferase